MILPLRRLLLAFTAACSLVLTGAFAADGAPLVLSQPQVAGISGFRAHWDAPFVLSEDGPQTIKDSVIKDRGGAAVWADGAGAIAFDALNRSVLVRFPDAAERIAAELAKGRAIEKVELVLPFRDEEMWPVGGSDFLGPDGYNYRTNWDTDKLYRAYRPEWHAVGWLLRRPWQADAATGPTFNANVNGASYWTRYDAGHTATDRYATQFGPAEVSYKQTEGRMDLTAALNDAAYGDSLGARLRQFAECGVQLRKWETYDHRYFNGVYEWATACGGRAILIKQPRLEVTFAAGPKTTPALPAPTDLATLKGGAPTAVMPTPEALAEMAKAAAQKPAWMEDWQWAHVQQLFAAQDPAKAEEPFWFQFVPSFQIDRLRVAFRSADKPGTQYHPAAPERVYAAWVDGLMGRQPRGWSGFESAREMAQWYLYHDTLPGPAQDAIKRYWTAWLMPDRETAAADKRRDHTYHDGPLVHPMADDSRVDPTVKEWLNPLKGVFDSYWAKTGDWRGNKSFFRSGFTYAMSTQNFNTTASAGALLAGQLIGSERAMADGRNGVEQWLMRQWAWQDGSGQEHIDHYYYAVTVAGNKAIADFSITPYDRLLGASLMTKNIEELTGAYHPHLRGLIAGSSRTGFDLVVGEQDGLQHVLHTLSPQGALRDYGTKTLPGGIATWGHDVPPAQVAQQTLAGPWAPQWVIPMVDAKPLPFSAKHTGWGGVKRSCYLADNYGIAVNAVHPGRVQLMAQWRREAKVADSMTDLGTMDLRVGTGQTRWANKGQGIVPILGSVSALHHERAFIALTSPKDHPDDKATSLQSSIGLFNFQDPAPTWQVFVDGKAVEALPFTCKQGQRITINDGVTWIGIVPLTATNLGRDAEVILQKGELQKPDYYKSEYGAALEINAYFYKGEKPLGELDAKDVYSATGGFVVEFGDAGSFADFAAFQKHFLAAKLTESVDPTTKVQTVTWDNGTDKLEAGSDPTTGKGNLDPWLVNGKSPLLAEGLERDTPYTQQGLGHVAKNSATLTGDEGRRLFLQTEPVAGVYCAWNPLPDLTDYRFEAPGGLVAEADGKVSITRVVITPAANTVDIDSAFKADQADVAGTANAIRLSGFAKAPTVTLNGEPAVAVAAKDDAGKAIWTVKLR